MSDIQDNIDVSVTGNAESEFKKIQDTIKKLNSTLGSINKNIKKIDNLNFSSASNQVDILISKIKELNTKSGSVNPVSALTPEEIELRRKELELEEKTLKVRKSSINVERQKAKNTKEQNLHREEMKQSEIAKNNANARVKEARADNLKEDTLLRKARRTKIESKLDAYRYTNDSKGGLAQFFSEANSRFTHKRGIVGLISNYGSRSARNKDSLWGKAFGGVLTKGTLAQTGVNVGGLALGGFATALGAAAKAIYKFRDASLNAYSEMQKIAVNLEVVMGSKTESDKVFEGIKNYAVTSPFSVQQTAEMAVLLKQSGVSASKLQETLELIGDVSSGNEEKMKRIANNYAQIQAIGHASMLDMRQFAYAGLPIYEEVAKHMNVTQTELRSMISEGKVTSEIIEDVFKNMTSQGGSFYKAVNKGSQTRAAREVNLQDKKQIALSNWGDYWWNNDEDKSLAQIILGLKESIWEGVGNLGKEWAVKNNYEGILGSENYLDKLKLKYLEALRSNNKEQAEEISKSINNFRSGSTNEDSIRATRVQEFQRRNKLINKEIVPDEYKEEILNEIVTIARNSVLIYTGSSEEELDDETSYGLQNGLKQLKRGNTNALLRFPLSANMEEYVKTLVLQYTESISESDFADILNKNLNSADPGDVKNAFAVMITEIQSFAQTGIDAMNDLAKGANSLTSVNAKYKLLYDQSEEGQRIKKENDKKQYEEAKALFNKVKEYYDYETNRLKPNLTPEQQREIYKSGFFSVSDANYKPEDFEVSNSNWKTNAKKLKDKVVNADSLIKDETISKKLSSLANLLSTTDSHNTDLIINTEAVSKALYELVSIANNSTDETVLRGINGIFQNYSADTDFAKLVEELKGKDKDNYIPLWQRIISNATGWSTDYLINGGDGFIRSYNNFSNKQIASGGIQGLVSAGVGIGEIASRLSYDEEKNKQGVRQIDWNKSLISMLNSATSVKSLKESSGLLQGMSKAASSQIEVLDKLKADMLTVGEDWSTITKDLQGQFKTKVGLGEKNIFDNAFGFINGQSNYYNAAFDEEGILSVYDKKTGENRGSVEELKKIKNTLTPGLQKFVDSIKIDSIIKPLDTLSNNLNALSTVVGASNTLVKESIELQRQTLNKRAEIIGNSEGTLGALSRATGKSIPKGGKKNVQNALTNFFALIGEMPDDMTYESAKELYDKTVKEYTGEEDKDTFTEDTFNAMKNVKEDMKNGTVNYKNIQALFEQLVKILEELLNEAQNNNNATDDYEANETANAILNDMYAVDTSYRKNKNGFRQQAALNAIDKGEQNFESISNAMTANVIANPDANESLYEKYVKKFVKYIDNDESLSDSEKNDKLFELNDSLGRGSAEDAKKIIGEEKFNSITEAANLAKIEWDNLGKTIVDVGKQIGEVLESVASDTVTSTFSTWGEALATGADASEAIGENFKKIGAGLAANLGDMLVQAGLSTIIGGIGDSKKWALGLAMVAAGGGLSFISGLASGSEEDDDKNSEYEKLLKIKEDLTDLLKQAREDSIYYETKTRHGNALAVNQKVNDAIITPSGKVISTHPDDYLIATKTPETLVKGGGQPQINFSVIDKSSGIKVTKQNVKYDEKTNMIEFEAVLENKINEIIATSKGDDAFNARAARLNGVTYVG